MTSEMKVLEGAAASPGVGEGPAFVVAGGQPNIPDLAEPAAAFAAAAATASGQLTELADRASDSGLEEAAEILRAQSMMASDPMFADEVNAGLAGGVDLGSAIDAARDSVAEALRNSGSEYLAERAADVGEIARRIGFVLAGVDADGLGSMTAPGVVVAEALTAADTASMDPALVKGFVTESGGPTGHVAVIARALGIPATVAVAGAREAIVGTPLVLVDGSTGEVVVAPDEATRTEYVQRGEAHRRRMQAAEKYRGRRIEVGGRSMAVAANVGAPQDIENAVAHDADGIGLFRTEFLFLDVEEPPGEDAQMSAYVEAVKSFDDPVVIRTFDIGGDKPASYLDIEPEENPFLGVRGMRLYGSYPDLALAQARALLRAGAHGDLWVMAPMVSTMEDAAEMRALFRDAAAGLSAEGVAFGEVKLGAMVEVPAAALNAAAMAEYVDFFSIGTNDLTQYTMAVDRTAAALSGYHDAAHPAVLRLCAMTAAAGQDHNISVSVCGEAASDPGLALLFAAMGMDKLSVTAPAVNIIKQTLAEVDPTTLAPLLEKCLSAGSAPHVREHLDEVLRD